MKLEQQVVSLEIAKRLKELGVKQESLFQYRIDWIAGDGGLEKEDVSIVYGQNYETKGTNEDGQTQGVYLIAAFSVAELGEMLPEYIFSMKRGGLPAMCRDYFEHVPGHPYPDQTGDSEADARGKMLIYLLQNKLINN